MKSFLLLILSLMTGFEASDDLTVCTPAWVQFTCKYPKPNKKYRLIEVAMPNDQTIQSSKINEWEDKDRFSLYHDTQNKSLTVAIKPFQQSDTGDYECKFFKQSKSKRKLLPAIEKIEFDDDIKTFPGLFMYTAYRTAKTTIQCDDGTWKSSLFCKDNHFTCDILSTKSSRESSGRFAPTHTTGGFSVSISNVSSQDAGVYWCGAEYTDRINYRVLFKQIELDVKDITILTQHPTIGQNFTYWCSYQEGTDVATLPKFFCKGEDPSMCQPLARTTGSVNTRFSMTDDKRGNITIRLKEVTTGDSGTYWCGARTTTGSNLFIHKLLLNAEHSPVTSSVSSTPSTVAVSQDGSHFTAVISAAVCVAVLVLVVILVFVYKRFQRSHNSTKGEAPNKEAVYDEIQEPPLKSDTGTSVKTIYVTAIFPTNPSAFMDYSKVNFQTRSGKVTGDTYSTVLDSSQCPTYSTIDHPSRVPEDPFYSTVKLP